MKKNFLILGLATLLLAGHIETAHAYSSAAGPDPKNATNNWGREMETKLAAFSNTSQPLTPGKFVAYDLTYLDGYTVTHTIAQTQLGQATIACVVPPGATTNVNGYFPCINRGIVYVKYDGTVAQKGIVAGREACVDSTGTLRGCAMTTNEATFTTGIIPLQSATDSGSALPVILNLQ